MALENEEMDVDEFDKMEMSDEEGGLRIDDIYIPPPPRAACNSENTGPRIMITQIHNNFFKSYAANQRLGPFHKCFNAIIGPNGSGKSNVIDSLLFVFGYRASKIRSKKISVLVHNSDMFRNVTSCTVSVHFALINDKEGDDYEIIPGSEFVVSRTANKDNSSFYQLNGRKVQFKEIAFLLRQHGIDLDHNRFLILQGEVEQIAMMEPKATKPHETGMLEYLEEIIGTSRFKVPLAKLEERVELLTQKRTEKLNRVKLVQKDIDELKGPMKEAVTFLKTENMVMECKNIIYQMNIYSLEEKIKSKETEYEAISSVQQQMVDKLKELHNEKKEHEDHFKVASKKFQNLEEKLNNMKQAFEKANTKDNQIKEDLLQTNKMRKKTKELLIEEQKKLAKLEKVPEENEEKIAACVKKQQELTAKMKVLEEERIKVSASIKVQTQELQKRKESLLTDLMELNAGVNETQTAFNLADSDLQQYLSNDITQKKKLESLRSDLEITKNAIEERTEKVQMLEKKVPLTLQSYREAQRDLNAAKQEEAQLITELNRKRVTLEETRSSMQASRSKGRVLDSLMQQKREGKCKGLLGRLGDLGAIDQKYDVAISTACGPLDNIVVETADTAQWCIEFLRKHNIGRAVFLVLEKQEHLRELANSRIQTPENVPRLYDLIHVNDERIKTAFYYALRNTLVADNLDQGSRIAYGAQRYRVVTLKGELFEMTGTMSGGGNRVSRGRMGQSVAATNVSPEEVERITVDITGIEKTLVSLQKRIHSLEDQVSTLENELSMKHDLEKYRRELQAAKLSLPGLLEEIKKQESTCQSSKVDPERKKQLEAIVAVKKESYDEACAAASVVKADIDVIDREIEEKVTGKLKKLQRDIKEGTTAINKCAKEITRLNVAIKTSERNVQNSKDMIATMEQDIIKFENNMREMQTERDTIEVEGQQLVQCIEELSEKLNTNNQDNTGIKKVIEGLTKKENKLKAEKIEIDEKVKTAKHGVKEIKDNINHWRAKIKHLKLKEIPDEQLEELKTYTPDELNSIDLRHTELELQSAEQQLRTSKPNFNSITEYREKQTIFIARSKELDEISEKKRQMRDMLDAVRNKRKEEFLSGYNIIKMKLKEMYQMITLGGDANFELVDTFDPFSEGVQFNVRPPRKSWKLISNLSGGEKTLSSLALVFALHYYKPSPLYVMDEIDAALDFKNVSVVGNYIKERTKNAQFIIISLRSNMYELCDNLVGIFKVQNCTKSATIDPRKFDKPKEVINGVQELE